MTLQDTHITTPSGAFITFPCDLNAEALFDERVEKIIAFAADKLTKGASLFPQCDKSHLCQELRMHLFKQMPKFNPQKSCVYTYATMVCNRKAKNLIRDKIRRLRETPATVSLNEAYNDDGETLADHISTDNEKIPSDVREKVESTLSRLSEKDREICEMIMAGTSLRAIARAMHTPWQTFYDYFTKHLQPTFKAIYGGA